VCSWYDMRARGHRKDAPLRKLAGPRYAVKQREK